MVSIYLHCDPTASHYLKLRMDAIFGPENFRNEIIWKRTSGLSSAPQAVWARALLLHGRLLGSIAAIEKRRESLLELRRVEGAELRERIEGKPFRTLGPVPLPVTHDVNRA